MMLKIFPIIIIPLFFIIIFLGVKNLTQNNSNIVEVVQEKVDNEKEQISAKTDKKLANVEELKEPIEKKVKLAYLTKILPFSYNNYFMIIIFI